MKLFKTLNSLCFTLCLLLLLPAEQVLSKMSFIPSPPGIAANSYILIDAATGETIVESNPDQRLPPASLTKIMTSYVAAHEIFKGKLDRSEEVLVSSKAWRKGGSKMYIKVDTRVKVEDLLRGMIIQSGNDASIALAEHIAGSEEGFAELMNMHAKALGMTNTHFVNATGWPAEEHYSTARDIAILTNAMINQFPTHYAFYSEKEFTYNEIKQPNRNLLLWRDESIDGVKTGHTEEAGYCLVSSAKRDDMRLISVVMGTNSQEARANQSLKLLNFGFRYYQTYIAYQANKEVHNTKVWMGAKDNISLGLSDEAIITIPQGGEENLKADVTIDTTIKAPIKAGQQMGTVSLILNQKEILEKPLVALEAVDQAGLFKRLWHWLQLLVVNKMDAEEKETGTNHSSAANQQLPAGDQSS